MDVRTLAAALPERVVVGDPGRRILGLAYHSREVQPGFLFAAIRGYQHDGHEFVGEAVARGAVAVLVERSVDTAVAITQIIVPDTRAALAHLACAFSEHPSNHLTVIGIASNNPRGQLGTAEEVETMRNLEANMGSGAGQLLDSDERDAEP